MLYTVLDSDVNREHYCVKSGAEWINEINDTFVLNTESPKLVIFGMPVAPSTKRKSKKKEQSMLYMC